ncbi:MAG TPA: hypothetical protein VNF08_08845 [Acidimicrobiales bacterium]|nr:hypothetical protein [Acidimicrobiales bacterium]
MARTRAQRRRRTLLITLALAVTLVVLLFARDVSRSAHGSATSRRSEDRSFGALANALIASENNFDVRLESLLSHGGTLQRVVFAARLAQLDQQLPDWSTAADQLRRPVLDHNVNDSLDQLTQERVAAYQALLRYVAHALTLPWNSGPAEVVANPAASLETTSQQWNVDRFALVKEPGGVRLTATSSLSAVYFAQNGVAALVHAPALTLHRGIGIAALRVSPSPLPASPGVLLLPPVTSVRLGVSVLNVSYVDQPVTLTIRVSPLNARGASYTQTLSATLGPLGAYAFVPRALRTAASERARIVVTLSGAPTAAGMVTAETYQLEMSPSGIS